MHLCKSRSQSFCACADARLHPVLCCPLCILRTLESEQPLSCFMPNAFVAQSKSPTPDPRSNSPSPAKSPSQMPDPKPQSSQASSCAQPNSGKWKKTNQSWPEAREINQENMEADPAARVASNGIIWQMILCWRANWECALSDVTPNSVLCTCPRRTLLGVDVRWNPGS